MKSKLLLLLAAILLVASLHGVFAVDENQYILKAGDMMLIQVMSADTIDIQTPVLPEGRVSIYPFGEPVPVAGLTLHEGRERLAAAIRTAVPKSMVTAELMAMAPMSIHVTGAVKNPGEYTSETLITLYQALQLAEGLLPGSSRKVRLTRGNVTTTCDIRKYLTDGDLTQNPVVLHDDRIQALFAENAAKVFVNNDTTNTVEYYELDEGESVPLQIILDGLSHKTNWAEYGQAGVLRDGKMQTVDDDFPIMAGDSIFVSIIERFVYISGNVAKPGRYTYNAAGDLDYYLGLAGGVTNTAHRRAVYIINAQGRKHKFREGALRPGDTIYVPELYVLQLSRYLGFVSTGVLIFYYLVLYPSHN